MKKTVVVFSGAGLSEESGIPTFRGTDGLWENHPVDEVASHEGWFKNKKLVLDFYRERMLQYAKAAPNPAHYSIAKLQEKYSVLNITQNIDTLLERAGCKYVEHLHGLATRRKCEWHKDIVHPANERFQCNYWEYNTEPVKIGDLCPTCGGQMRPDIVFFGEKVNSEYDHIRNICEEVKYNKGIFICIGSSLEVYPAAYYVSFFSQTAHPYYIDLKPKPLSNYTTLKGKASEKMVELAEQLLNE